MNPLAPLLAEVATCRLCAAHLPLGPRPVVQLHPQARLLIIGQAPGTKVHETGIPFNYPSGDRLRDWLGVDRDTFYDASKIALMPCGFCYPGRSPKGGDHRRFRLNDFHMSALVSACAACGALRN